MRQALQSPGGVEHMRQRRLASTWQVQEALTVMMGRGELRCGALSRMCFRSCTGQQVSEHKCSALMRMQQPIIIIILVLQRADGLTCNRLQPLKDNAQHAFTPMHTPQSRQCFPNHGQQLHSHQLQCHAAT